MQAKDLCHATKITYVTSSKIINGVMHGIPPYKCVCFTPVTQYIGVHLTVHLILVPLDHFVSASPFTLLQDWAPPLNLGYDSGMSMDGIEDKSEGMRELLGGQERELLTRWSRR